MQRLLVCLAAVFSFTGTASAQPVPPPPPLPPPPSVLEAAAIPPAEAQADGSIQFRFQAPRANDAEVAIQGEGMGRYPMQKGTDGVWSARVGPLAPEVYVYNFNIDGARLPLDTVTVPAATPRAYDVQDVPRGTLTQVPYFSKVQNRWRNLVVYLPAAYYRHPQQRFAVLYLFAGMSEDDWVHLAKANLVLDNLIARGKATPMIVVMPNNTTGPVPVPALQNAAVMEQELTREIMPLVESRFATIADRDHRAIAGVSFGGGTAFTLGSRHLDRFAYVGEFGTGAFGGADKTPFAPGYAAFNPDNITPGLYAKYSAPATRPRLLFMSVGDADPRAPYQRAALQAFRDHEVSPVFHTYPGAHEWKVFRPSLEDMLPLLFR